MDVKIEEVLNAYVSSNRDEIILKAFDWNDVKRCKAIMFWEKENGPKQISWGQIMLVKSEIEDIQQYIRESFWTWIKEYRNDEIRFEENIKSANVYLLNF